MTPRVTYGYEVKSSNRRTAGGKGNYIINSIPSGAQVTLDGFPHYNGITPDTLINYATGNYSIILSKKNYIAQKTSIQIQKDDSNLGQKKSYGTKTIRLKSSLGKVLIQTIPASAKVYMDGKYIGVSPLEKKNFSKDNFNLRLEKEGYYPYDEFISVDKDGFSETIELKSELGSDSEGEALSFDDFKSEAESSEEYDRRIEILQSLVESKNYSKQEDIELQAYR